MQDHFIIGLWKKKIHICYNSSEPYKIITSRELTYSLVLLYTKCLFPNTDPLLNECFLNSHQLCMYLKEYKKKIQIININY